MMFRESGMMLKPPGARSAWPAGPVDTSSLGPVRLSADTRTVRIGALVLAGHHARELDPRFIDALIVGDVRFVRERHS